MKALSPSFLGICSQSPVFRCLCTYRPRIRVWIPSRGAFLKTLAAPAMAQKTPVISEFMGLSLWYQLLQGGQDEEAMAWFSPASAQQP